MTVTTHPFIKVELFVGLTYDYYASFIKLCQCSSPASKVIVCSSSSDGAAYGYEGVRLWMQVSVCSFM